MQAVINAKQSVVILNFELKSVQFIYMYILYYNRNVFHVKESTTNYLILKHTNNV